MQKYYKIAGLTVKMDVWGRTETQAVPYETAPADPDLVIRPDIESVRELFPELSGDSCLYLASEQSFCHQLLNFDGLRIHASALILDGRAYLFAAPCGTGKSTHTGLWRQVFGDGRVRILNDDKPAVRLEQAVWYAYGTPWCGKTGQNLNLRAPLAGIAILQRAAENRITPYRGPEAICALLQQVARPKDPRLRSKALELLDALMTRVPIWKLQCGMDPEAARIAYRAMSGCGDGL